MRLRFRWHLRRLPSCSCPRNRRLGTFNKSSRPNARVFPHYVCGEPAAGRRWPWCAWRANQHHVAPWSPFSVLSCSQYLDGASRITGMRSWARRRTPRMVLQSVGLATARRSSTRSSSHSVASSSMPTGATSASSSTRVSYVQLDHVAATATGWCGT